MAGGNRVSNIPVISTSIEEELETLLFQLIKIESHSLIDNHEKNLASYIKNYFEALDIEVKTQEVVDGRFNVIARLRGKGKGPVVLLNGHLDTVPPYTMESAFQPFKKDGKIYGRGSADMKGALAAMMMVLTCLKRNAVSLAGDVVFAATVGEEDYSPGAYHLSNSDIEADYIIVGEPTGMEVGIAHKGVVWGEATFEGVSVHGSVPDKGVNAIYKSVKWLNEVIDNYIPKLQEKAHPVLGNPTINIGQINGGTRPVIVPGTCSVKFEQRLLPGETEDDVISELQSIIDQLAVNDPDMKGVVETLPVFKGVPHRALETDENGKLPQTLCEIYNGYFDSATKPKGLSFWTDGALLNEIAGTETVVCGPGSIEQAHSDHEYISAEQLNAAYLIYLKAVLELCRED